MYSSSLFQRPLRAAVPVRLRPVALVLSGLVAVSALAQSTTQEPVLVTALRMPERVGALAAEVSVIDRAMLDRSTGRTLSEVLAQLPGVQFSSNGGLGKSSSLYFRGLEARHTLLLIDGVRVGSATLGTPSLDNLPLDAIERIEVVRGPMSALYGSDAVGGVVQIFTQRGLPGLQPSVRLTAGGERRGQVSAGLGWAAGGFDAALQLQHTEERGASATNPRAEFNNYNPDRDGFRQNGGSLRLGWQLAPDWRLDGVALKAQGRTGIDDGPGVDAQAGLLTELLRVQAAGKLMPGWQTQLSASRSTDAYDTLSSASTFATLGSIQTRQTQLSWENRVATPVGTALVLAEHLQQEVSRPGTPFTVSERSINALGLGLNGSADGHLWQAALRHDRNSQFGNQTTGALAYALQWSPAWRAGLSYGTSFVAPSFNQLYYPGFGNDKLVPEEGRQAEAHLRWTQGVHTVRATAYDYRIRGYISSGPQPVNIPRTHIQGVTLAWEGQWNSLKTALTLDHVDPRNDTAGSANFGKLLPRRASNALKAQGDWTWGAWTFGSVFNAYSHRFDKADNVQRLGGYATADVYADWALRKDWTVGLRLNNLADRSYETAWGYNQPGRAGFITLRWKPN